MKAMIGALAMALGLGAMATPGSMVGTWKLVKSENPLPSGQVVSYCNGVHGQITYTSEGYMAVALNCGPATGEFEPATKDGRMFFYAGRYEFDGKTVTHFLENASVKALIGEAVTRTVEFQGDRVVLSGEVSGEKFSATWERRRPY